MVKYNPKLWFKYIFKFSSIGTFRMLWKEMVIVALTTALFCWLHQQCLLQWDIMSNMAAVYSIIGFVLSLLLVFRTNTAYDRWWEGRKKWGLQLNNSRNLASKIAAFYTNDENTRLFFFRHISSLGFAMKEHLRNGVKQDQLTLNPEETNNIMSNKHVPNAIISAMYNRIVSDKKAGKLTGEDVLLMEKDMKNFSDILGACERILNTPIPFSYNLFLKKFIFIYIVTMPFSFIPEFGYSSPFIVTFIFYILVSMEVLAEEIENPFGLDPNDLPTEELCKKIHNNTYELLTKTNT